MASQPERAAPPAGPALGAAAALASAAALWHATGLLPTWWLTWVAPIPVLAFALRARWRTAAIVAFAAWAAGGLNLWHYYRQTIGVPLPVVLVAVTLPAAVFAAGVLLVRVLGRRKRPLLAALALPATWTAFEHVAARLSPHGSFGSLAYTQLDFLPVVQLAAVCGGPGIAFLLTLVPTSCAVATWPSAASARRPLVLGTMAVLALALAFGAWRLRSEPPGTPLRVGLAADDEPGQPLPVSDPRGRALVERYAARTQALRDAGADIVVLPETVVRVRDESIAGLLATLAGAPGAHPALIVVGVDRQGRGAEENLALATDSGAGQPAAYAKQHLLPPFEARYRPGDALTLVRVGPVRAGLAICKDLDFPSLGRAYAASGAALMLVPAWDFVEDGWLHARMAVLRGVEGGFAVARSARGGRLTLSDDRGRVLAETRGSSDTTAQPSLVATVRAGTPGTPYTALGDWLGWLTVALLALAAFEAARPAATSADPPTARALRSGRRGA